MPGRCLAEPDTRIHSAPMEAFFIALMVAVALLTGWVALVVLYKLIRADNS